MDVYVQSGIKRSSEDKKKEDNLALTGTMRSGGVAGFVDL